MYLLHPPYFPKSHIGLTKNGSDWKMWTLLPYGMRLSPTLLTPALGILRKRDRRLTAVLALPPYLDPTRVLERPVSDVQAEYAPHDIKQP
jgi:hypothetical protein